MRYPADHKEQTRARIVAAAARVFRRQGFQGGSVDDVMAEAGLTAGGFYAHFDSKDELFAAALVETLRQGQTLSGKRDEGLSGTALVQSIARKYLSPAHRRLVDQGCPLPPLVSEITRQSPATRRAFQGAVDEVTRSLAPHFAAGKDAAGKNDADPDRALAFMALLVGGMSLARAVADEETADRILAACRALLDDVLEPATTAPGKPRRKRPRSSTTRKKGSPRS